MGSDRDNPLKKQMKVANKVIISSLKQAFLNLEIAF